MKTLDRQTLDYLNETRSNRFGWRGQFRVRRARFTRACQSDILSPELVTTAAIHPNDIAGEAPTLSPFAPASPDDLDQQHELGQFLTPASDTSPLIPLPRRLSSPDSPHPICDHPLPLPQARDIIRCGAGYLASLFELPRSEVHLLDAGAGAGALSAALVGRLCRDPRKPKRISITAYEIDAAQIGPLKAGMYLSLDFIRLARGNTFVGSERRNPSTGRPLCR